MRSSKVKIEGVCAVARLIPWEGRPLMRQIGAIQCHAWRIAMNRYENMLRHVVVAGAALAAAATAASAGETEPFKLTNIHFETNASACDMGIQMSFDTDGVSLGSVQDPNGQIVYRFGSAGGPTVTHDITEGFQERVEPQIIDLERALGCERDEEEPEIWLTELLSAWPAGTYVFRGSSEDANFRGFARLSHKVPAGPEILAPEDGDVVPPDENLLIRWKIVTTPILPELGPVNVVGYHVVIADATNPEPFPPGKIPAQLDVDLPRLPSSLLVPKQFLRANRIYEFEILATEAGGNQTITEGGVFCTEPIRRADCEKPE